MLLLLAIGFVAGIVTAISPCVLPVLPIVLAGGATGRKPLAIVAGIVASFSVFTLFAAWLLDLAGLPKDVLRDLAIALLFLVALTLLWPPAGELLARPLQFLTRRRPGERGGGFLLGASLGLVFVPCAGPVLAAVTVLAANEQFGLRSILLTLSYALGAAGPMLAIALAGRRAATGLRSGAATLRRGAGVLVALAALAIALGFDQRLQTSIPGYTNWLQNRFERSSSAQRELEKLTGARAPKVVGAKAGSALEDYGPAPEFAGISSWLNSEPLTLAGLKGRVVLIDFWTYSCINCLRTLPYIKAWDTRYRDRGLTIVGVHTPEFAFERELGNVRTNVRKLGLRYPVALDNGYETWNAWHNQYWPAKYLIDADGRVRFYHFGEGDYDKTEAAIRELLAERGAALPAATHVSGLTPSGVGTPETYLGHDRLQAYTGKVPIRAGAEQSYVASTSLGGNQFTLGGRWTVDAERVVAGKDARLLLSYRASKVYLVLAGKGTVRVLVDGEPERTVQVTGDRLYTLVDRASAAGHQLELRFSPGVAGYAFTFG